jgi:methylmalonyl-CoA/ethylmalonyl-CoA epimerase
MLNKIEHLGIAVKDMTTSIELFTALLGVGPYKQETVVSEHVITSFFQIGESKIELLQATSPDSAVAKFLEKNKEGVHHIAFDVTDIHAEIDRLTGLGFQMIHAQPKLGADNKLIAFLHPKSTNSVLIELCQDRG